MNSVKVAAKQDVGINVKLNLSALWAAMMLLYIYADVFSLYKPGNLQEMLAGRMGPFPVTQASLATASLLMLIPALMVFLSLALNAKVGRWANIVLGVLYTAVNIGNLIGETWAYYILYGIVEILLTVLIVWHAWTWRNPESQPQKAPSNQRGE